MPSTERLKAYLACLLATVCERFCNLNFKTSCSSLDCHLFFSLREGYQKKNGLFSDIDHISFNTHPPPPNNDIWQKWLSVRNFTTHPPRRNNDIFLNKRVFDNIFQEVKCNDEDQLLILNTLGKVSKRKLGMSNDHVTKLLAPYSFEGVKYKPKSLLK